MMHGEWEQCDVAEIHATNTFTYKRNDMANNGQMYEKLGLCCVQIRVRWRFEVDLM